MRTIYLLFQTDLWQTKSTRVFFGAFDSKNKAIDEAKKNELYHPKAEVVILETTLNEFAEK